MGATNCPETPRQRMISMMYLVLTALLALNVSKEILDSFLVVNEGLIITNENFDKKVNGTYTQFEKQLFINKAKVLPFYEKAMQAKKMSKELVDFIENAKVDVIAAESKLPKEECKNVDLRHITARDKYNEGTRYFIGDSPTGAGGRANEMKNRIEAYKAAMLNLLDSKSRNSVKIGLETKSGKDAGGREQSWEMHHFYRTILTANVVTLNQLILEVKNAEFDVVNKLLESVSGKDFKFDKIGAKVVAKSNYVLTGETFEADIFVAAYDTKQNPTIEIGSGVDTITNQISGPITTVEGYQGVGKLKIPAGGPGVRQFGGLIKIKNAEGVEEKYPFNSEYVVGTPSATISPTKMNVFYIGVDNPVSISVPGASNEQVTASITGGGGTITRATGNGLWTVKVTTQTQECMVNVAAKMGATSRAMGSMKFRVKRVPNPVAYVANVTGGPIAKGTLIAAGGIIPKMDNFDFELYFQITSFTLTMNKAGDLVSETTSGSKYSPKMSSMLNSASRGQKIYFEDIKAKGPDGTTRNLGTISFKIM
jgi:gliding motility-associated protein GldM